MKLASKLKTLFVLLLTGACSFAFAQEVDEETRPVTFAFVTDMHISDGSANNGDLELCIKDINSQKEIEFVIFGGDNTDFGTDKELGIVKSIMDGLTIPYYVVAGNHDANWSESGCNTFLKTFGYEHFCFEKGGWRFMGCNSGPDMRMAPALIPRESMVWLKSVKEPKKTIFINHYGADSTMLNYFEVAREIKRLDGRFMIGGHWHHNHTRDFCGLPGVTCRSSYVRDHGNAGYNIVRVYADSITLSNRQIYGTEGTSAVELAPWYKRKLNHVVDTVTYDEHGLPGDYPWMRYDVNDKYDFVKSEWEFQDDANIVAGLARDNKKAYYTTASGYLRAVSLKNGKRVWSQKFGGKIFSTPALCGKYLVFGCTDGFIYAVKPSNGKVIWKYEVGKAVVASPAIYKDMVYIGASDNVFRKLDLKTGELVWKYEGVAGHAAATPFVDDDQVVFGTWGRRLYSLDPETGKLQWSWQSHNGSRMISPASTAILKTHGRIFVAVPDRRVFALDAKTGQELFWVRGGRDAIGLSEDGNRVYDKTMFGRVLSFNADVALEGPAAPVQKNVMNPEENEVQKLGSWMLPGEKLNWDAPNYSGYEIAPTALVECGGTLFIPTDKGNILALDSNTGEFVWAHKISVALVNPMQIWKEGNRIKVLAATMDGVVTLLSLPLEK